jgi:hypothetical protein
MALAGAASLACSAGDDSGGGARVRGPEAPATNAPPPDSTLINNPAGGGAGNDGLVTEPGEMRPVTIDDACVVDQAQATLVKQPVDIILVLDNSGSMSDELQAVESNINVNFASILASSQIDYRVILISRHRQAPPTASEEASTSICVTTPLSGLADCTQAQEPVLTDRFFQYSIKIDSTNSFDLVLDTYNGNEEDKFDLAPLGWSQWLRPGAKKVFLEMTDDQPTMPIADFAQRLAALSPADFGSAQSPSFVFHSIIGIAAKTPPTAAYLPSEPVNTAICNIDNVENAGVPYQELSRLTGGLRFPLCEFTGFDVVFRSIADDVVFTSNVACDFAIPNPPTGLTLNLDQVGVAYTKGDGSGAVNFGQARALAECESNAFYIQNNRINLCPQACDEVRRDPLSKVDVLFTCKSTFIPK